MEVLLLRLNKKLYRPNPETNVIEPGQTHSISFLKQDLLHDGYRQIFRYIQRPPQTNQLEYNQIFLPSNLAHTHATDRKSTRLNSSHVSISYAVFCLK